MSRSATLGAIDWEKRKLLLAGITFGASIILGLSATLIVRRARKSQSGETA